MPVFLAVLQLIFENYHLQKNCFPWRRRLLNEKQKKPVVSLIS